MLIYSTVRFRPQSRQPSTQQARARGERDRRPNFSAEFLDDDDEAGMEGNLGAIRRNFRKSKQSAAALHAAGGSRRGRGSAGKSYDDRSGDEEAEEVRFSPPLLILTLAYRRYRRVKDTPVRYIYWRGSMLIHSGNDGLSFFPALHACRSLCITLTLRRANLTTSLTKMMMRLS